MFSGAAIGLPWYRREREGQSPGLRGGSRRPGYNLLVTSERWLPAAIFAALVLVFAAPWAARRAHDALRPRLVEVRIVTATDADPVFREGPRHVGPGEGAAIAVALRLSYPLRSDRWLTPAERLELDGAPVDRELGDAWPERDRRVRVFWFTVESGNVGGTVTPERAAHLLRYRSFLANEMGRGLRAASLPEAHNDDHLGPQPGQIPVAAGTLRLYARVEGNGGHIQNNTEIRATHNQTTTIQTNLRNDPFVQAYRTLENDRMGIYEAGFLRLREVSLSYDLPGGLAERIGARRGMLSVGMRNVAMLWTAEEGWSTPRSGLVTEKLAGIHVWDPEVRATGATATNYQTVLPPTASFTATLRLSF